MREFRRWAEYETLEPFGDFWTVQHGAVLCAMVNNYGRRKGTKAVKAADFLPPPLKKKPMSNKQMGNMLTRYAAMHNAALKQRGE